MKHVYEVSKKDVVTLMMFLCKKVRGKYSPIHEAEKLTANTADMGYTRVCAIDYAL